jgi:type VI secretion system protein ImpJ
MHLAQHHFQVQNAYFENVAGATLDALFHAPYGVLDCRLDDEALLNGTAAVIAARGIMPDGLAFSFPADTAPRPLRVAELFSPTQSSHLLVLGVPADVPGRANCELEANGAQPAVRFSAQPLDVVDETTGLDARAVQFARKNFRLMLDTDVDDGWVTLPIARIQRDGAGRFVFDYSYIAPSLRIGASRSLREMVARLVEVLEARAAAVRADRAGAGAAPAEYAAREIAGLWLLHALNAAIPPLHHWLRTNSAHPEQLYMHMSQLAGALCTFALSSNPRDLPAYDHDEPEACFRALEQHIRRHLDIILPSAAITLALQPSGESLYTAPVTDTRCLEPGAHWFLGVRSNVPAGELITRTTRLVKICSAKFVARLVKEAYPGLVVEHVPAPPAELSPRIGMQYFAIRRTDPCWKSIVESGEVGIYVPAAIAEPELELKVVMQSR